MIGFFRGAAMLAPIVLWACAACSCVPETAVEGVLGVDAVPPVFLGCRAVTPTRVEFCFSEPVDVTSLRFDPPAAVAETAAGAVVSVILAEPTAEGARITADLLVEDERGNTLSVLVPFRTRNDRMPKLRITEVRTEYSKPKVEFVEFLAETAGQLGALRLVGSAAGFDTPIFEFPGVEVAAGEYVVVHLRTLDPSVSMDETGKDLTASGGTEALPTARDFWVPGTEKRIRKTDAIAFLDQDGKVLDAVLMSETASGEWTKDEMAKAARFLGDSGAWKTGPTGIPLPAQAVASVGSTTTRTVCRDESAADGDVPEDWYITATSCATPGAPNRTERYVPPSP